MITQSKEIATNGAHNIDLETNRINEFFFQFGVEKKNLSDVLAGSVSIRVRYLGGRQLASLLDENGQSVVIDLAAMTDSQVRFAQGVIDQVQYVVSGLSGGAITVFCCGV